MVCVWKPVMVLGFPACPTVSTACPTRTLTGRGLRSASTCAARRAQEEKHKICFLSVKTTGDAASGMYVQKFQQQRERGSISPPKAAWHSSV